MEEDGLLRREAHQPLEGRPSATQDATQQAHVADALAGDAAAFAFKTLPNAVDVPLQSVQVHHRTGQSLAVQVHSAPWAMSGALASRRGNTVRP